MPTPLPQTGLRHPPRRQRQTRGGGVLHIREHRHQSMQSRAPTNAGSNPATTPCTSAANTANGRTPTPTARGSRTRAVAGVTAGLLVLSFPFTHLGPRSTEPNNGHHPTLTTTSASSIEKGKDTSIPKGCDSRSPIPGRDSRHLPLRSVDPSERGNRGQISAEGRAAQSPVRWRRRPTRRRSQAEPTLSSQTADGSETPGGRIRRVTATPRLSPHRDHRAPQAPHAPHAPHAPWLLDGWCRGRGDDPRTPCRRTTSSCPSSSCPSSCSSSWPSVPSPSRPGAPSRRQWTSDPSTVRSPECRQSFRSTTGRPPRVGPPTHTVTLSASC